MAPGPCGGWDQRGGQGEPRRRRSREGMPALDKPPQCPRLIRPGEVRLGLTEHTAVGRRGAQGADTRARWAALGEGMGGETGRSAARGQGGNIAAERRRCGPPQRGHVRQPSGRPPAVWLLPWRAGGGGGGAGRLREASAPSQQPARLRNMQVTPGTAAFLVQPLPGEPTPQRTRGWHQARAGSIRVGHASGEADLRPQRPAEAQTSDPRAQAVSRRQCAPTHSRDARMGWPDDDGARGADREDAHTAGACKGGHLLGPPRCAQGTDQATPGVRGRAQARGHLHVRLAVNQYGP
jgi:hypothetical protein